jgi:hypothetical protein
MWQQKVPVISAVEVVAAGGKETRAAGGRSCGRRGVDGESHVVAADRAGGFHVRLLIEHRREEQRVPGAPGVELPAADGEAVGSGCETQTAECDDPAVRVVLDVGPARDHGFRAVGELRYGDRLSVREAAEQGERERRVVAPGEGSGEGFGERVE